MDSCLGRSSNDFKPPLHNIVTVLAREAQRRPEVESKELMQGPYPFVPNVSPVIVAAEVCLAIGSAAMTTGSQRGDPFVDCS